MEHVIRDIKKYTSLKISTIIFGRPVVTGFKVIASSTRATVQTSVDGQANLYELTTNNAVGYTLNRTYPSSVEADLLSINYYDNYAFLNYTGWNVEALSFSFVAEQGHTAYEQNVRGLATGAKVKVLGSAVWLNAVQYYDKYYRPIQIIAENHLTGVDRNTNKYNNLRQLIETRLAHHNQSVIVLQKYNYDHTGRITRIYQNINSAPSDQLVAQYEYNELGQLVDKKLHNTSGTSFLQSVDYRYAIRGWIASINNSQLNVNSANNDETNDYFGMEFIYTQAESGLSNAQLYNGNISAVKWKGFGTTEGTTDQKSYKYTYDKSDRLLTATSQMYTGSAWTKEANVVNEGMTYDHNGNVKTLQRNHRKHQLSGVIPSYVSEAVDNLTYSYSTTQGNQLIKVEDAVPLATGVGDFKNNANVATEYTYNNDGSLTADQNKGISSITYNMLGKASIINFTNGRKIEYTYDAGGNKLKMKNFQGTTLQLTTDYLGGFVYENGALKFFGSPEGRVVKNGSAFEYQYSIADHQGNTRVVFTSATPAVDAPKATFEGDSGDGASAYTYNASNVVTFVGAATSGTKVIRMNQAEKIGARKSLKVFPGDKIDLEVWEYHEGTSGFGTTSTPLTTLVTTVSGAFGGVSGGAGESGLIYNGVNSAVGAYLPPGNQGSARPAAYLNYILFDTNYKVLDMGWQLAPATIFTKQKLSFPTLNIKEPGTIFIYLSYDNDSNNWVYFDDLKVTHTKSNILQYNEYYPFGLQTSSSWTREGSSNNYLYNEASELNQNSGWYETFFRGYDPTLGRFHQVDPLAHASSSHTPYNYAYNDPVYFNDPNGDRPLEVMYDLETQGGGGNGAASYDYSDAGFGGFSPGAHSYGNYLVGPGSGNHWGDGMGFSDWSANGGSNSYRAMKKSRNYVEKGNGNFYQFNPDGGISDQKVKVENGQAYVYNQWEGKWVKAEEVVNWDPTNQNKKYRQAAINMLAQQGGLNPLDVIRNSTTFLLRMALGIPDAVSMGINVDGVGGVGIDATPISKLKVFTGPDRGETKFIGDAGYGVGLNIGVAFSITEYYYFDPTGKRPMEIGDFQGLRFSAGADLNFLGPLEAGVGVSIAPIVPSQSIYMIGITRQYGVSPPTSTPVSGDVNFGWTWFYK